MASNTTAIVIMTAFLFFIVFSFVGFWQLYFYLLDSALVGCSYCKVEAVDTTAAGDSY